MAEIYMTRNCYNNALMFAKNNPVFYETIMFELTKRSKKSGVSPNRVNSNKTTFFRTLYLGDSDKHKCVIAIGNHVNFGHDRQNKIPSPCDYNYGIDYTV